MCETAAGREAEVEDEDVDVVGGVEEVGASGYECDGFTLSENLRRKRLFQGSKSATSLTLLTFHNVSFQIFSIYH